MENKPNRMENISADALHNPYKEPLSLGDRLRGANEARKHLLAFNAAIPAFTEACKHTTGRPQFILEAEVDGNELYFLVHEVNEYARIFLAMLRNVADGSKKPRNWNKRLDNLGFGIVDDDNINAHAFKYKNGYYIAITRGLIVRLHNLFALAMSNRELFSRIRDGRRSPGSPPPPWRWSHLSIYNPECLKETHHQLTSIYREEERDMEREERESRLFIGALSFIWGHEWGHIVGGHLDFKAKKGMSTSQSEHVCCSGDASTNEVRVSKAMESDADLRSLYYMALNQIYHHVGDDTTDQDVKEVFLLFEDFLIGAMATLLLLEESDESIERINSTHPHPYVRLENIALNVSRITKRAHVSEQILTALSAICSQVLADVVPMAITLRLPQLKIVNGLTASDRKEITEEALKCEQLAQQLRTLLHDVYNE